MMSRHLKVKLLRLARGAVVAAVAEGRICMEAGPDVVHTELLGEEVK
jgi:hypothetical protein